MRSQPSFLGLTFLIAVFVGVLACGDVERAAVESVATSASAVMSGSAVEPLADAERTDDSWIDFASVPGPENRLEDQLPEGSTDAAPATNQSLTKKTAGVAQRSWSPTGEWIVYVARRDGRADLFLARPDGSDEVRLTDDAEVDRYPVWSPDGETIAFARRGASGWGVFTLSPFAATEDATVTPQGHTELGDYVRHLDWSPDGAKIAFDRVSDGQTRVAVLDLETAEVRVF